MIAPRVFFTADTHFGHTNVIRYSNRPFKDVSEMENAIVEKWNEAVRPVDAVFFLGDFALVRPDEAIRIVRRLNGQKHIVWGNHDKELRKKKAFLDCWASAQDYRELTVTRLSDDGVEMTFTIVLSHYPFLTWNKSHHGSWNLHGHSHGSLITSRPDSGHPARRLDVGVDVWGFAPVSLDKLIDVMQDRAGETVDHHRPEAD